MKTKWFWIRNYRMPNEIDEKNPPKWEYISSHVVPEKLRDHVHTSLLQRGVGGMLIEPTKKVYIDMGGMIFMDRHIRTVVLNDLRIDMPSSHVPEILEHVQRSQVRFDIGGRTRPYFKHHFFFRRSLCLTPAMNDAFIRYLQSVLEECLAIQSAENKITNAKMAEIQKNVNVLYKPRPVRKKVEEA